MTTTLHLVRHGKASAWGALADPGAAQAGSYDALHPQGVAQARLLGAALQAEDRPFARVVCGPMKRHQQTLEHLKSSASGLPWPATEPLELLREVALDELFRGSLTGLLEDAPHLRPLWAAALTEMQAGPIAEDSALVQLVGHVASAWRAGTLSMSGVERWEVFRERAGQALQVLARESRGASRVLVVTSLGVISCMLDVALREGDRAAEGFPFRWLSTSSVSRLAVTSQGFLVEGMNDVRHLDGHPTLVTIL